MVVATSLSSELGPFTQLRNVIVVTMSNKIDISYHSIQHAMNSYRLIKPVIRDDMNSYARYVCPQTRSSVPVVHCAPYNVGRVGYIRSSEVQISYQYWFSNFRCDSCNVLNVSFFFGVTRR